MKSVCDVVVEEEQEDLDEDLCRVDDLKQLPHLLMANRMAAAAEANLNSSREEEEEGDDIVGVRVLPSRHFATARSIPPRKKV